MIISWQTSFGLVKSGFMCLMFSGTTPLGILLGMIIFYMTGYDDGSSNALIQEGRLSSLSRGILDLGQGRTISSQTTKACAQPSI